MMQLKRFPSMATLNGLLVEEVDIVAKIKTSELFMESFNVSLKFYAKLDSDISQIAKKYKLRYYIEDLINDHTVYADNIFRIVFSCDDLYFASVINSRLLYEMRNNDHAYSATITRLDEEVCKAFGGNKLSEE